MAIALDKDGAFTRDIREAINSNFSDYSSSAQSNATLTKTSDTTLAAIPGMSVPLAAGGTYNFRVRLNGVSGSTGGVKAQLGGTATATALNATTFNYNGTTINAVTNITALSSPLTNQAAVYTDIVTEGCIVVGAAGTLTVQGAQNTSNGTATTFLANGCFLKVWRVS